MFTVVYVLSSLKPKKVKYPTKQLYISAKQGDLQKVIHLLGKKNTNDLLVACWGTLQLFTVQCLMWKS